MQPLRYGFEGIITNEFHTLNGTCSSLVPQGPGYENIGIANQVCTTVGSQQGQAFVDGNTYVKLSYGYSYSHIWRVSYSGCLLCPPWLTNPPTELWNRCCLWRCIHTCPIFLHGDQH